MAERLPYLAILAVSVGLVSYGIYRRRSRGLIYDRAFTSKLAWTSISLATALVGSVFPSLWVFMSFVVHGGRIEENLPPGFSVPIILTALLVGAAFTIINTVYGYTEHLDSETTPAREDKADGSDVL